MYVKLRILYTRCIWVIYKEKWFLTFSFVRKSTFVPVNLRSGWTAFDGTFNGKQLMYADIIGFFKRNHVDEVAGNS